MSNSKEGKENHNKKDTSTDSTELERDYTRDGKWTKTSIIKNIIL